MLATNISTPYRKRRRRHSRIAVAVTRDRRPARHLQMPPAPAHTVAAPDAPWPGHDDRFTTDLDQATWEDAEWR